MSPRVSLTEGVARHHLLSLPNAAPRALGKHGNQNLRLGAPALAHATPTFGGKEVGGAMELLYPCCSGLDVHKHTVVACLSRTAPGGRRTKEVRTFGTTTQALTTLRDWLCAAGCTHVAMESTGVYWKPVHHILEGHCELLLVNAQHVKAVPGRKTDVADSEWLADLLQHGLLRASFVPPQAQRELRDLTRTRTKLVDERSAAVKRLQAVLEDANLKVAGVATNIVGVSGRAMLAAL